MFVPVKTVEMKDPFSLIGKEKLLISAGVEGDWNTMTASWGTMGVLWNKNVINVVIRPQRYTYQFMEREPYFTVSVLDSGREDAYRICGTLSGRDCNKAEKAGLTPFFLDRAVTFEQARLAILCRKIYVQDLDPAGFLTQEIEKNYPMKDYHRLYCGEVVSIYQKR